MRLKPLPKILIIVAVVGVAGYFGNEYLSNRKVAAPTEAAVPASPSVTIPQVPPTPSAMPSQPAPAAVAPAPQPTTTDSSGIDAVLKAGKK